MLTPRLRRIPTLPHHGVDTQRRRLRPEHIDRDVDGIAVDEFGIVEDTCQKTKTSVNQSLNRKYWMGSDDQVDDMMCMSTPAQAVLGKCNKRLRLQVKARTGVAGDLVGIGAFDAQALA